MMLKKTATLFILMFISCNAFSQKHSLEQIVKTVFRAVKDSNTKMLDDITITYSEYKNLCEPIIDKELLTSEQKLLIKANLRERYNRSIAAMKTRFDEGIYWYHYKEKNVPYNKFRSKYINYEYYINEGFNKHTKIASVRIFSKRDSAIITTGNFFFYKVSNDWKLSGIIENSSFNLRAPPQYQGWSKNFSKIKNENFPYEVAEEFWNALVSDSMTKKLDKFFFSPEQYLKAYKLYEPYVAASISDAELNAMTFSFKSQYLFEFSTLRDSLIKHGLALPYKKEFLEDATISNTMNKVSDYEGRLSPRAGKQYGISFQFTLPDNNSEPYSPFHYQPGINFFFIPGTQKNTWKLLGAITSFKRTPERQKKFPLEDYEK